MKSLTSFLIPIIGIQALNVAASEDCGKLMTEQLNYKSVAESVTVNQSSRLETENGASAMNSIAEPPYLLHFWASWCGPCRPELQELAEHINDIETHSLPVIPVSIDLSGLSSTQDMLQKLAVADRLPAYADPESVLFKSAGGQVLPMTVLVNKSGQVVYQFNGSTPWSHDAYQNLADCQRL